MKNTLFWDTKTPVRTSQETRYVSATESNRLLLYKVWGFHGGDYEECSVLEYKIPVRTSQMTHYVTATELSRLMLCKIWGFHVGDYEECRVLGCKYPVRTSQETHYVSDIELNRLMLCKIWGFHARWQWRMPYFGMLQGVALIRTDVSEERKASINRVTRIGEIGTTNNRSTLRRIYPDHGSANFLRIVRS
jgi:hypothetical protein